VDNNHAAGSGVYAVGNIYDRTMRGVHGHPGSASTQAVVYRRLHPILEVAESYTVQTYRHDVAKAGGKEGKGDTVFIEYASPEGLVRIALPPGVTAIIGRQHEALSRINRKRSAQAEAARRKAEGIVPGFMKGKKRDKGKGSKRPIAEA
jgi:hypothetical protein